MNAVVANCKLAQAELKEFAQVAEREKVVRNFVTVAPQARELNPRVCL